MSRRCRGCAAAGAAVAVLSALALFTGCRAGVPKRRLAQVGSRGYSTQVELDALEAIKNSLTDPFKVLQDWVGNDPCKFHGIFCEVAASVNVGTASNTGLPLGQMVVTGLDWNAFGLSGVLSLRIGDLKYLGYLHLSQNKLQGVLPDLSRLRFLNELDVSGNQLSGPFPKSVLSLKKLKYLDLRFNNFSGALPPQLFQMGLDVVAVNNNQFTSNVGLWQTLPQTKASLVVMANNPLGGSLPADLAPMASTLEEIVASNVGLSGGIPPSITSLKATRVIDVSSNSLIGAVPTPAAGLQNLVSLNLANNKLGQGIQGLRPFLLLPRIQNVTVSSNYFTGPLGPITGISTKLNAAKNCISGMPNQRDASTCAHFASMALAK